MGLPVNALIALAAAAFWGGGDFSGGMGVKAAGGKTAGALRVVALAHALSLAVLLAMLAFVGGSWPHGWQLAWGLMAGVAAAFSLTAFYVALSRGAMGPSAAVSGLLAAAIPAAVSSVMEGSPNRLQLVGFALAAVAIWLIAAGPALEDLPGSSARGNRATMVLAIFGGLGFGFYFVALKMANGLGVLEPMALSRSVSLVLCLGMLGSLSVRGRPTSQKQDMGHPVSRPFLVFGLGRGALWGALGVAVLDTGGNMLFLASTRMGRLDVAAVLASLYPAGTILLAAWRLHERPTQRQWMGMAIALGAVVMITI